MKKYIVYFEFLLTLIIFVLPPLLVNPQESYAFPDKLSVFGVLGFVFSVMLFWQFEFTVKDRIKKSRLEWLLYIANIIKLLGELVLCAAVFQLASFLLTPENFKISKPELNTLFYWICIPLFFMSAFFEEAVYRLFLPCVFYKLIDDAKEKFKIFNKHPSLEKILKNTAEVSVILLFAFAHRVNGWFAVVNAFAAGIILRLSSKKFRSIIPGFAAHFIYNCFNFVLLIL